MMGERTDVIVESDMEFGIFPKEKVFRIENSKLHQSFGEGIKTVEFVLLKGKHCLLFIEAKKSCPNKSRKDEDDEKAQKFENYFSEISDKFVDSLQMMFNVALQRNENIDEIGDYIGNREFYSKAKFLFVLVIKTARDEEWLAGPKEELEARLLRWRKLWGVEIVVLNEELAAKYGLVRMDSTKQAT